MRKWQQLSDSSSTGLKSCWHIRIWKDVHSAGAGRATGEDWELGTMRSISGLFSHWQWQQERKGARYQIWGHGLAVWPWMGHFTFLAWISSYNKRWVNWKCKNTFFHFESMISFWELEGRILLPQPTRINILCNRHCFSVSFSFTYIPASPVAPIANSIFLFLRLPLLSPCLSSTSPSLSPLSPFSHI